MYTFCWGVRHEERVPNLRLKDKLVATFKMMRILELNPSSFSRQQSKEKNKETAIAEKRMPQN